MKNSKSMKGITLIALVITIVVLIILASVSITLIVGEDGLIQKAQKAKEEAMVGQYKEKIELVKAEAHVEYGDDITLANLKDEFDKSSRADWVNKAEIFEDTEDSNISKIDLVTNDAYEFYVTIEDTEYRGHDGQVVQDNSTITISANPANTEDSSVTSIDVNLTVNSTGKIKTQVAESGWGTTTDVSSVSTWEPVTLTSSSDTQSTGQVTCIGQATDGDYYLHIRGTINGKAVSKYFGPYTFQSRPTTNNLICEKASISADETTATLRLGSNKAFTGWEVKYTITNGETTSSPASITPGQVIQNVNVTKGDVVVIKYIKTGSDPEDSVSKTLNADDFNLVLLAEMIQYNATWGGQSITSVKQALDYLDEHLPSGN